MNDIERARLKRTPDAAQWMTPRSSSLASMAWHLYQAIKKALEAEQWGLAADLFAIVLEYDVRGPA